jgi:DNA-binding MarR family transcriptional regulator
MAERGQYKREAAYWAEVAAEWNPRPEIDGRPTPEAVQKALWFAAMRWRRTVERVTMQAGITFTQWLVLDAIRELFAETGDASIQNEISVRVELDRSTVSVVMRALESKELVSRGIDIVGTAWRTFLTKRGVSLLGDLRSQIRAASAPPR